MGTISKFLTVRSCDKKSKKKTWTTKMKIEEKKHVKPKCDCKRKKEEKFKNQEKQKTTFFPIIKNHNSITTPKKINPFLPTKKSLIHRPDFFYCCFFCLVLCLPLFF